MPLRWHSTSSWFNCDQVVGQTFQRLQQPDPRTYIGSGKTAEIQTAIADLGVQTVIFDDELSPGQQRSLEKALGDGVRLCDRTALILDIFSQRAATREGHLQVAAGCNVPGIVPPPPCSRLCSCWQLLRRSKWQCQNTNFRGSRGCGVIWSVRVVVAKFAGAVRATDDCHSVGQCNKHLRVSTLMVML